MSFRPRAYRCCAAVTLVRRWSLAHVLATVFVGCTLDLSPVQSSGTQKDRSSAQTKTGRAFEPWEIGVGTAKGRRDDDADSGATQDPPSTPGHDAGALKMDAGGPAEPQPDAGNGPSSPTTTAPTTTTAPAMTTPPTMTPPAMTPPAMTPCDRDLLRRKADTYMAALTMGDASSLNLHPRVRYTENGRDAMFGSGVWTRHATVDFARHVVDEMRCTTVTQAVLSVRTVRSVFGVRLSYQDGQLLEAEAQVVPDNLTTLIDIETLIPDGKDPWAEPVPEAMRSSRADLLALAERYFDSAAGGIEVPPSAAGCTRHQNGAPLGDGRCDVPPGKMRFEQKRFPAVDEPHGVVTAIILYDKFIGQYMIRVIGGVVQSIEITGGASSSDTGW